MKRAIIGFTKDEHGNWVALLSCGHPQHVRHDPPFTLRPWVESAAGRAGKIGVALNCVRCDRLELPDGWIADGRGDVITATGVPSRWWRIQRSDAEHWLTLEVIRGCVRWIPCQPGPSLQVVDAGNAIAIPPDVMYRLDWSEDAMSAFTRYHRPNETD